MITTTIVYTYDNKQFGKDEYWDTDSTVEEYLQEILDRIETLTKDGAIITEVSQRKGK